MSFWIQAGVRKGAGIRVCRVWSILLHRFAGCSVSRHQRIVQPRSKPLMRLSDSPEEDAAAAAKHEPAEFAHSALENLFDVSPDAIFVTDATGVIRGANPRAAELFGYTQVELFGQPIENLVPERFRRGHPGHRENYNAHPRARQMGAALNLFGLRKDGTEFSCRHHVEANGDRVGSDCAELCARCDGAAARDGSFAAHRSAASLHCGERERLRYLPAGQGWPYCDVESGGGAHQGL